MVYNNIVEEQQDTRNHNPRVGGSSPSSATIRTSEQTIFSSGDDPPEKRFTHDCKPIADLRPLAIDLFCGLGGWTDGLLALGYRVIGYDIEEHVYGDQRYNGELVVQDVMTLHGSQFKDAALIVASPPCQAYSYMAMPWKPAKAKAAAIRADTTGEELERLNQLFNACFRIQKEASAAAGRHIPMVVENVKGAQAWVGPSKGRFGSYYLWGDIPALMPESTVAGRKNTGGSWFKIGSPGQTNAGQNPDGRNWKRDPVASCASGSAKRKAASAMIAKIPEPLSRHIGEVYWPAATSPTPAARGR